MPADLVTSVITGYVDSVRVIFLIGAPVGAFSRHTLTPLSLERSCTDELHFLTGILSLFLSFFIKNINIKPPAKKADPEVAEKKVEESPEAVRAEAVAEAMEARAEGA